MSSPSVGVVPNPALFHLQIPPVPGNGSVQVHAFGSKVEVMGAQHLGES